MSQLREPSGDPPEGHRARLIAGTVLLAVVVVLAIVAIVHAVDPASPGGSTRSVTSGGISVSLEIDQTDAASGTTISGHVVVVNDTGHPIGLGGPGSCPADAFVVNLVDGHGHGTAVELATGCRDGYQFPAGTTNDTVQVPATDGAGRHLPAGDYQAVLSIGHPYPLPDPGPVPVHLHG